MWAYALPISAITQNNAHAVHLIEHNRSVQSNMNIWFYTLSSNSNIEPTSGESVDIQVLFCESEESVSLSNCAGSQHDSTVHPACSASTTSSSDTNITESIQTHDHISDAIDLLKPRNKYHKRELLQESKNQFTSCHFPKKKYSNGKLYFNPSWYELKEARVG